MKMYNEDEIDSYIEYSPARVHIERFLKLGYNKETAINKGLQEHIESLYVEIEAT